MHRSLFVVLVACLSGCYAGSFTREPTAPPHAPAAHPAAIVDAPPAGAERLGTIEAEGGWTASDRGCRERIAEDAAKAGGTSVVVVKSEHPIGGPKCSGVVYADATK